MDPIQPIANGKAQAPTLRFIPRPEAPAHGRRPASEAFLDRPAQQASLERARQIRSAAEAKAHAESPERIREAAKGFEEVLLQKLLDEMQKTIPDGGLFDSSATQQVQSLFNMMLAKHVAKAGGIGLADQLYGDFCRMANVEPEPTHGLELER